MFKGSMVALVTPMTIEQTLDLKALERVVEFHLHNNTDALVVAGTTGESAVLSIKEQNLLINAVLEQVNGAIPVIAGTGAQSTEQAILNAKHAESLGVNGALIMTPAYIKPPQRGLIAHYEAIAKQTDLPIILYNVPGRTVSDLLPESIKILSERSNIVAIKEATGSIERTKEIIDLCGNNINLLSGDDASNVELLKAGACGVISVTANVAPLQMHNICRLAIEGKWFEVEAMDKKLQALHRDLFIESNPIPVKWAMSQMNLCQPTLRLPLADLDKKHYDVVMSALKQAEIL